MPFVANGCELWSSVVRDGRVLSVPESTRPIIDFWLDVPSIGASIRPGDTIGIFPRNPKHIIEEIIDKQGWTKIADDVLNVEYKDNCKKRKAMMQYLPAKSTIRQLLTECLDLEKAPSKLFLLALLNYTTDPEVHRGIKILCSKEMMTTYTQEIMEKKVSIKDVLIESDIKIPFSVVVEHSARLLPRPYSIISSTTKNPGRIRLAFSWDSSRPGLTTSMLRRIVLENANDPIYFYLRKPSAFRLEVDDMEKDLLMIGPGLGVISFIGMLDELDSKSPDNSTQLIFTSWRNKGIDDVFRDELEGYPAKLHFTYTRDTEGPKLYVQDLIVSNKQVIAHLIQSHENVKIFICGEGRQMIPQIEGSILKCLEVNSDPTEAKETLANLKTTNRLVVEQWF